MSDHDPSKPNHYRHDSLGDPHICKGDHNHPEAGQGCTDCGESHPFYCGRCQEPIQGAKGLAGTIFVTVDSPIMPNPSAPTMLCFDCGNKLAEFLLPDLKDDPKYQKAFKAAQRAHHAKEN